VKYIRRIAIETLLVAGLAWCGPRLLAQSSNPSPASPTTQAPSTQNQNPSQASPGSSQQQKNPGEPQSPSGRTVTPGVDASGRELSLVAQFSKPELNHSGPIDKPSAAAQPKGPYGEEGSSAAKSGTESASAKHTAAGADDPTALTLEVSHRLPNRTWAS
jgi:hypothetical protein